MKNVGFYKIERCTIGLVGGEFTPYEPVGYTLDPSFEYLAKRFTGKCMHFEQDYVNETKIFTLDRHKFGMFKYRVSPVDTTGWGFRRYIKMIDKMQNTQYHRNFTSIPWDDMGNLILNKLGFKIGETKYGLEWFSLWFILHGDKTFGTNKAKYHTSSGLLRIGRANLKKGKLIDLRDLVKTYKEGTPPHLIDSEALNKIRILKERIEVVKGNIKSNRDIRNKTLAVPDERLQKELQKIADEVCELQAGVKCE